MKGLKLNFKGLARTARKTVIKHGPQILTAVGIAGAVASVIFAAKATPEVVEAIEEAEDEKGEELTKVETVKVAWKYYIPTALTLAGSVICIASAEHISAKRNAALLTAYGLSERAFHEYKDEVINTFGEKKEHKVKENIAEKQIKTDPVVEEKVEYTRFGNTLCRDWISGRYFRSDVDAIKRNINNLNQRLQQEQYISLNEYYYENELDNTGAGEILGFNIEDGLIEPDFMTFLTDTNEPCVMVSFVVGPRYDFANLH